MNRGRSATGTRRNRIAEMRVQFPPSPVFAVNGFLSGKNE